MTNQIAHFYGRNIYALAVLCLCALPTAGQQRPQEYHDFASVIAAPLYPEGQERPSQSLDHVTKRDGKSLLSLTTIRFGNEKALALANEVYGPLTDSAASLAAIAGVDGIQPSGTDVLKKGLGAAVGGEKAQQKFENSLGGFILAEASKAFLRAEYRQTLRDRRVDAWNLWEVAEKFTGPTLYKSKAGVGFSYDNVSMGLRVTGLTKGQPAEAAGLKIGDVVTHVDGRSIKGMGNAQAVGLIAGKVGTTVQLGVQDKQGKSRTLRITRATKLPKQVLQFDFNSSFGGAYSQAHLWLNNTSGKQLNHVSLFVRMTGGGKTIDHTHYVRTWDKNNWHKAVYCEESKYCPRETIERVEKIEVWLYSDEAFYNTTYHYTGANIASDMNRLIDSAEFSLSWHDRRQTLFGWEDAACKIELKKVGKLRPNQVEITYIDGNKRQSLVWNMRQSWSSGVWNKQTFRDSRFNGMKPDKILMKLYFDETSYEPVITFSF